jgi:Tol biopolymer transport system component
VAGTGALVNATGASGMLPPRTLVWVDRTGHEEPITAPPRAYTYARLSPDGTRVALDARDEQNDIWIWDLARRTLQQLTIDPGMNRSPVWTPNSKRAAFTAERDGVECVLAGGRRVRHDGALEQWHAAPKPRSRSRRMART